MNRRRLISACMVAVPGLFVARAAGAALDDIDPDVFPRGNIAGPMTPPDCDRQLDCRFAAGMSTATARYCGPAEYSRAGTVVSEPNDCNVTTTQWSCQTCGKSWEEKSPT